MPTVYSSKCLAVLSGKFRWQLFDGSKCQFYGLVCALICLSTTANGQRKPEWELYTGYLFTHAGVRAIQDSANQLTTAVQLPPIDVGRSLTMNGVNVSLQQNSASWWGGIIDFSGSYATKRVNLSQAAVTAGLVAPGTAILAKFRTSVYTIAGGPQFTYRKAEKIQPFVRVMLGAVRSELGPDAFTKEALNIFAPGFKTQSTSLAVLPGLGVDYVWKPNIAFRTTADYLRTYLFEDHQGSLRLTVGIDFRIGGN